MNYLHLALWLRKILTLTYTYHLYQVFIYYTYTLFSKEKHSLLPETAIILNSFCRNFPR